MIKIDQALLHATSASMEEAIIRSTRNNIIEPMQKYWAEIYSRLGVHHLIDIQHITGPSGFITVRDMDAEELESKVPVISRPIRLPTTEIEPPDPLVIRRFFDNFLIRALLQATLSEMPCSISDLSENFSSKYLLPTLELQDRKTPGAHPWILIHSNFTQQISSFSGFEQSYDIEGPNDPESLVKVGQIEDVPVYCSPLVALDGSLLIGHKEAYVDSGFVWAIYLPFFDYNTNHYFCSHFAKKYLGSVGFLSRRIEC